MGGKPLVRAKRAVVDVVPPYGLCLGQGPKAQALCAPCAARGLGAARDPWAA